MVTSPSLNVGDIIADKYRVERVIGEGGFAVVLQARHLLLHQSVAIKVLRDREDREQVGRFMREARSAIRLKSEHVATVSDVGVLSDGGPYMVMELLEGEDLGALIDRSPLAVPEAVDFLLQACEGVAQAHALGIVHRDLKPRNLFLTRRAYGRPVLKVLDFGLAKNISGGMSKDSVLTQAVAVMGSPPYMSPEQVRSATAVDMRSDIWSLGVSLYETLTGRLPFDGDNVHHILACILGQPPTPIENWQPDVPAGVCAVIARCLAKDPDERFRNVSELADALEPYAPPSMKGAADRVKEILFAPQTVSVPPPSLSVRPPPAVGSTRAVSAEPAQESVRKDVATQSSSVSDSVERRPAQRTRFATVAGAVALVSVVVVAAVRFSSQRATVGGDPPVAAPSTGASAASVVPYLPQPAIPIPSANVEARIPAAPDAAAPSARPSHAAPPPPPQPRAPLPVPHPPMRPASHPESDHL